MHNTPSPPPHRTATRPHPRALGVLGALVLSAHLAVLEQAPALLFAAPAQAAQPAAQRSATPVQLLPPPDAAAARATPSPPPSPPTSPTPEPAPAAVASRSRTTLAAAPAAATPPVPDRPEKRTHSPVSPASQGADTPSAAAEAPPPAADEALSTALMPAAPATGGLMPTRAERPAGIDTTPQAPPSVQLEYRLQRGMLQGSGELEWRHDGQRYRLRLEGQLPLLGSILVQRSEGGFDAAGLAPLRHTEQRLRRSERAVNFIRPDDGSAPRITFSASTASLPLRPGAQDRVSWMAQIATRLAGVRRLPAGSRLEMDVASTGGEVQHWVFVLQQIDADGSWHWRRQSDRPDDTLAEVWTDPALGHWPRRVRLTERRGDPLELTLRQVQTLPP